MVIMHIAWKHQNPMTSAMVGDRAGSRLNWRWGGAVTRCQFQRVPSALRPELPQGVERRWCAVAHRLPIAGSSPIRPDEGMLQGAGTLRCAGVQKSSESMSLCLKATGTCVPQASRRDTFVHHFSERTFFDISSPRSFLSMQTGTGTGGQGVWLYSLWQASGYGGEGLELCRCATYFVHVWWCLLYSFVLAAGF